MKSTKKKSTIETAAMDLRAIVQAVESGGLLGSEDELVSKLGVSRATLRQVARLLEREGWLIVKRGINGGYFAGRPDLKAVENSVSAYLSMVDADAKETAVVGTFLWMEILKRAAEIRTEKAALLAQTLRDRVAAVRAHASMNEMLEVELDFRAELLELINSRYIEFIFQINIIYGRMRSAVPSSYEENTPEHYQFVEAWRQAKMMELAAIQNGDGALAVLAARHSRNLWDVHWRGVGYYSEGLVQRNK